MKRKSIRVPRLIRGVVLIVASALFFTRVGIPLEKFIFDISSRVLLGYYLAENQFKSSPDSISGVRVIGKDAQIFQEILIINQSVPVGTRVLFGDVLVGFVIEEGSWTSKVQALSSPFYKINGVIGRTGIPIELEGKGANILEARIPRGADVVKGDTLFHDTGDALAIGTIADIVDVASDPFLILRVLHSVNLTMLTQVELLPPAHAQ